MAATLFYNSHTRASTNSHSARIINEIVEYLQLGQSNRHYSLPQSPLISRFSPFTSLAPVHLLLNPRVIQIGPVVFYRDPATPIARCVLLSNGSRCSSAGRSVSLTIRRVVVVVVVVDCLRPSHSRRPRLRKSFCCCCCYCCWLCLARNYRLALLQNNNARAIRILLIRQEILTPHPMIPTQHQSNGQFANWEAQPGVQIAPIRNRS